MVIMCFVVGYVGNSSLVTFYRFVLWLSKAYGDDTVECKDRLRLLFNVLNVPFLHTLY